MVKFNIEKLTAMYNAFVEKEHTELDKAVEAANNVATTLGWDENARDKIVNEIVSIAKKSLEAESKFWGEVAELCVGDPVAETEQAYVNVGHTAVDISNLL